MSLVVIHPTPDAAWADMRLQGVLRYALEGREVRLLRRAEELDGLSGQTLLFAVPLGEAGINLEYTRMLLQLRTRSRAAPPHSSWTGLGSCTPSRWGRSWPWL